VRETVNEFLTRDARVDTNVRNRAENSMSDQNVTAPAGWHEDPYSTAHERFWDGSAWTEQTRVKANTTPPWSQVQPSQQPASSALSNTQHKAAPSWDELEAAARQAQAQTPTEAAAYVPVLDASAVASSQPQRIAEPLSAQPFGAAEARGHATPGAPASGLAGAGAAPRTGSSSGAGFFRALFDFSFSNFVTLKFAKVLYIIGIALNVLLWLGGALVGFVVAGIAAANTYNGGVLFLAPSLGLLFGWLPAFVNVVILRVVLEFVVASVRTAQNTAHMAKTSPEQQTL